MSRLQKYGFLWVTGAFFLFSLFLHWFFGWLAYVDEQTALGQAPEVSGYLVEMSRDTFENWQSEFLQLIWQVAGLSFLLFVGSPQSKEEDDRLERKLDAILRAVRPDEAEAIIGELAASFPNPEPSPRRAAAFAGAAMVFMVLLGAALMTLVAILDG